LSTGLGRGLFSSGLLGLGSRTHAESLDSEPQLFHTADSVLRIGEISHAESNLKKNEKARSERAFGRSKSSGLHAERRAATAGALDLRVLELEAGAFERL
jgi:hypothetical protein